jgi:hypothetical protein
MEIQKLHKNIKDATSLAAEESSKHRATKEYFGSMIAQVSSFFFFFFFVFSGISCTLR